MPIEKPIAKKIPDKRAVKPPKSPVQRSFKDELLQTLKDTRQQIVTWFKQWDKAKDIIKNNFELGQRHLSLGNLNDALLRFKFVVWLDPNHANAWYHLGATYMAKGNRGKAAVAFRKALELKPGNEEALYLLTVASGKIQTREGMPRRMPVGLAREYFDSIAEAYTEDQLYGKYEGHNELCNAIRSFLVPGRIDHQILELGIGTGMCGPLLRDVAAHISGVDLSGEMLAEAAKVVDEKGEKIYNALIKRELHEFLQEAQEGAYDIVMAANVFGYIGALEDVFTHAARVLKPKGLFAFTADVLADGDGYAFDPEETKFRFAKTYLQELARANGLTELKFKEAPLYPDYAAWVCVFQK